MTPKEAEAYVRERWEDVDVDTNLDNPIVIGKDGDQQFFLDWLAAAEFTLQREEEIRQKREEIVQAKTQLKIYQSYDSAQSDNRVPVQNRILAILESQLAALLVGWKETPLTYEQQNQRIATLEQQLEQKTKDHEAAQDGMVKVMAELAQARAEIRSLEESLSSHEVSTSYIKKVESERDTLRAQLEEQK